MKITNTYNGSLDDGEFPKIVYKYRNWDSPIHKRFILNREVFLANPNTFKDNFDCKIPIRHDLMTSKQILEYATYWSKIGRPNWSRQQHREDARIFLKEKFFQSEKYKEEFRIKYFNEFFERIGILSLTADSQNSDMWNKYADNSKGVCIGYNSRIMFEHLGGGGAVEYVYELPILFPEPIMTHHQISTTQVYTKLREWEFEKEYRTMKFWEIPANEKKRQVILPKEAFNSVILGENISENNRNNIKRAIKENIGNIPIIDQSSYKNSIT